MKILVDAWISRRVAAELAAASHDVAWVGDQQNPPSDLNVLQRALRERRVVITLDKDFGELVVTGQPPNPAIIRLVDLALSEQSAACLRVLERHPAEIALGALLTVSASRVRIRAPR